jgi:integrase
VYRPAVLRANRLAGGSVLAPQLTFHALRHTYAFICVAAGLDYMQVCRFMGHSKPTTTLAIYTHLFNTDDHAGAMAALGAMEAKPNYGPNVVPLWR